MTTQVHSQPARVAGPTMNTRVNSEKTSTSDDSLMVLPDMTAVGAGAMLLHLQKALLNHKKASTTTREVEIQHQDELKQELLDRMKEALRRQQEAESHKGGFFSGIADAFESFTVDLVDIETITDPGKKFGDSWDKTCAATFDNPQFWRELESGALEVGKWAAVAGSVALSVVSCGAGTAVAVLAIAGAVCSCAGAAESSFHVLESLGVDPDVAKWTGMGLSVGGALMSGGAGLASAGTVVGSAVAHTASEAGAAANVVGAGGTVVGGAAHTQVAKFESRAKDAAADAKEATLTQKRVDEIVDRIISAIKKLQQSTQRALECVGTGMQEYNRSRIAAATVRA